MFLNIEVSFEDFWRNLIQKFGKVLFYFIRLWVRKKMRLVHVLMYSLLPPQNLSWKVNAVDK